jgi:hypothetical protein
VRGGAPPGGGGDMPFKHRVEEADVQRTACLDGVGYILSFLIV